MIGKVRALQAERGFGFVRVPGQQKDYFLHVSEWRSEAPFTEALIGEEVDFTPGENEKGLRAVDCRLVAL